MKAVQKFFDAFMDKSVMADVPCPVLQLLLVGHFAVQEQIRGFQIGAFFREFLDGISAIAQNPLISVDVGNPADAGSRVIERRIVTHHAEIAGVGLNLAKVHGSDGSVGDRHLVTFAGAVVGDGQSFAG